MIMKNTLPIKRRYKVRAHIPSGYYGEIVEAYSNQEAIAICREKYKHLHIFEFDARSLGVVK